MTIGFPCPSCGSRTDVRDSRPTTFRGSPTVRRRRKCPNCGSAFSSYEAAIDNRSMTELIAAVRAANGAVMAAQQALTAALVMYDELRCDIVRDEASE